LEKPDNGLIKLDGKAIEGPGPERALIFQQFGLMPWLNVEQNVLFGLANSGLSNRDKLEKVKDAIARVGLEGFETFHP